MPWWNRQLKEQKPQLRPDPAHAQLPCDPEAVGSSSSRHSVCSSEARAERGVWKTPSAGAGSDGARLSLRLRCVRKYALPSQVWTAEHVVYLRQRLFRPVLVAMYQDCHCSGARRLLSLASLLFCARIQHAKGQWRGKKAVRKSSDMPVIRSTEARRSTKSSLRRWPFFPCMPHPQYITEVLPERSRSSSVVCFARRVVHASFDERCSTRNSTVYLARSLWCVFLGVQRAVRGTAMLLPDP